MEQVLKDVANGQLLSASLAKHKNTFGEFAINIIKIGEEGGILDKNLEYLAGELTKRQELKKKVIEVLSAQERRLKTVVKSQILEGVPRAKLLFVLEVLPNEEDRLTPYLRDSFGQRIRCGGEYQVEFAYSINEAQQKLMSFKPDLVLINFDSLYQISCGQLASRIVESPYRPKEVITFGLNLEAQDKQTLEQLGVQYVDQRKSFAKLITTVKQTALRHAQKAEEQGSEPDTQPQRLSGAG